MSKTATPHLPFLADPSSAPRLPKTESSQIYDSSRQRPRQSDSVRLELVESALGCSLSVFECLRFAMRDQFLMARWAEQFPANDGAAGAIGRKIEHHQFVNANASAHGVVGADEPRVCLPGD